MATKSKSDHALLWSIVALVIAAVSIGYCFTYVFELFNEETLWSNRAIVQLTRLLKGGAVIWKKTNGSPVIWAALVALFLLAFVSIVQQGQLYIGKSYVDTYEFKEEVNLFYENIGPVVLNPIDPDGVKKEYSSDT